MARAKKPETPPAEIAAVDELYSAETLSPALSAMFAEMGIEGGNFASYVVVHKLIDEDGKESRIWKGDINEHDLDKLASRFGSGDYTVRLYVQDDSGQYRCRGTKTYSMLLDPAQDAKIKQMREKPETALQPASAASGVQDIGAVLSAALEASQKQTMAMIAPFLAQAQAGGGNLGNLKELAGIVATLKGGETGPDPMKMLTMFKTFMDITGSNNARGGEELTEDQIGPNKMLYEGFKMFMETFGKAKAEQIAAGAKPAQIVAPAQVASIPAVPVEENAEDEMNIAMMVLLQAAQKGDDVEKWAERIYDDAPDAIIETLQGDQWFEELIAVEPKFTPHKDWLVRVRDKVLAIVKEESVAGDKPDKEKTA